MRYVEWIWNILHGNFGYSYAGMGGSIKRSVSDLIAPRLYNTFFLAIMTAIIAVPLSLFLGIMEDAAPPPLPAGAIREADLLGSASGSANSSATAAAAIEADPNLAAEYTARGNLVGVITNGTAVLGLGDIGPLAAKPVKARVVAKAKWVSFFMVIRSDKGRDMAGLDGSGRALEPKAIPS